MVHFVFYSSMPGCFFAKQKVDKRILPLAELRDLASAESVDAFTEAYAKLLQNHPDCPVRKYGALLLSYLRSAKVSHNSDLYANILMQVAC